MRKKKHPEHVNHERWLVSYADFMTLLFAFFVVMFSVSQVDSKQVGRFTESFNAAVGILIGDRASRGPFPGALEPDPTHNGTNEPKRGEVDEIEEKLTGGADAGADAGGGEILEGVSILRNGNELVLRFSEAATFASGDATLKDAGVRALRAIADVLRERRVRIRVEGHTDNVPIGNARYRSNWELSTARATSVVEQLVGPGRIDPRRLSASGYGEFRPLVPNTTPELRAQNRRVDIVISELADLADTGAPPRR